MSVFKAYDIRGVYGKDLTPDVVRRIGYAVGKFFGGGKILIGMDVRTHSPDVLRHLVAGLLPVADVELLGNVTTPMTHFASRLLYEPAVMITASHNPPEYNGLKVMHKGGIDLTSEELQRLKEMLEEPPEGQRGLVYVQDVKERYFQYLENTFGEFDISIGFDPANAAGVILRPLLKRLFKRVSVINGRPDGRFPSHPPDPEKPENLRQLAELVKAEGLDAGVALDGDGDRVGLVTAKGDVFRAEKIAYMLISHYAKPGDVVVLDATMPLYLERVAEERGVKIVRERVGHSFQKPAAIRNNAAFWAEYSGHVGFREHYYFDDGIYTALKVLDVARGIGKTLDDLLAEAPKIYEERIDIRVDDQRKVMEKVRSSARSIGGAEIYEIDGVDIRFRDGGRLLIRPSNTEPLIRVKIEAGSPAQLGNLRERLGSLGLA
ncbi:phosphoglucomutase [Thermoproteus uzoniensis 768-20]|uniref:Phosphoglucomutase n=1 Tax=Thermoproteus uzoniensis (strain 768-20) TaxID=999630 RepID=F2L1N9_THEU7|nr:phosphomannomutase/phosphoglucomutase [Thermoproteus uzoniensis]AEA12895.1 phosphoglucomutase [Thermoproteus uzoniensis 768-20]